MAPIALFLLPALLSWCILGRAETRTKVDASGASKLVKKFKTAKYWWQQTDIAEEIVALGDKSAIPAFEVYLHHEDRHLRCAAALVVTGLGDDRGFDAICAVLKDRSDRPKGHGHPGGNWSVRAQIEADRYYAVHVLAILKDARAVPILVPLLKDPDINYKVAWALGEIGNDEAIEPLIEALGDKSPTVRFIAIGSLEKLGARLALPRLRSLLKDTEKTSFGQQESVAAAARRAISRLEEEP